MQTSTMFSSRGHGHGHGHDALIRPRHGGLGLRSHDFWEDPYGSGNENRRRNNRRLDAEVRAAQFRDRGVRSFGRSRRFGSVLGGGPRFQRFHPARGFMHSSMFSHTRHSPLSSQYSRFPTSYPSMYGRIPLQSSFSSPYSSAIPRYNPITAARAYPLSRPFFARSQPYSMLDEDDEDIYDQDEDDWDDSDPEDDFDCDNYGRGENPYSNSFYTPRSPYVTYPGYSTEYDDCADGGIGGIGSMGGIGGMDGMGGMSGYGSYQRGYPRSPACGYPSMGFC